MMAWSKVAMDGDGEGNKRRAVSPLRTPRFPLLSAVQSTATAAECVTAGNCY